MAAIDVGVKVGATALQVAWVHEGALVMGRVAGRESVPARVAVGRDGQLVDAVQGSTLPQAAGDDSLIADVPRLLGTDSTFGLRGLERRLSAEELMATVLANLKSTVGVASASAVLAVPGWCSFVQRGALIGAAGEAGFATPVLLDAAEAAVLGAYFPMQPPDGSYLIFHLGATSFEAALVTVDEEVPSVVSRQATDALSLRAVDQMLAENVADWEIRRPYQIGDFAADNPRYADAFARLRAGAERVRLQFSRPHSGDQVTFAVDNLLHAADGRAVSVRREVTRAELDGLVGKVVDQAVGSCEELLSGGGENGGPAIIFTGGGTLWPSVQQQVTSRLALAVVDSGDPLTVVVRGAAAWASALPHTDETVEVGPQKPTDVRGEGTSPEFLSSFLSIAGIDDLSGTIAIGRLPSVELARRPFACLALGGGERLPLDEVTTIGRWPDRSLVLSDPEVSRDHAVISWDAQQGRYMIQDSGSKAGTFVNGLRLQAQTPQVLGDGDTIAIVGTTLGVQISP